MGFGTVAVAAVGGTSSYGAGVTRALQAAGIEVEPRSAALTGRHTTAQGKPDPLDAYTATRCALASHGLGVSKDAHTSALRALLTARRSTITAHTAVTNQIHACWSRPRLSERYRRHRRAAAVTARARYRPASHGDPPPSRC